VNWAHVVAVMAKFYGWSPKDAFALTWSEVRWWADQADAMKRSG